LRNVRDAGEARIRARPHPPSSPGSPGLCALPFDGERASYLYVPRTLAPETPAPLLVVLHGAGGHAHQGMGLLRDLAQARGLILLAPASNAYTWDVILDEFGPDVVLIDRAMRHVFDRYPVDAQRLAIGGFSDGASYALSVGLTNGDLFTHVIAFSPGFAAPADRSNHPRIFVSHGADDQVLPIDACSRRIVPALRRSGLHVEYFEFDGEHSVPPAIAEAALDWFLPEPVDGTLQP
jgi:phospholipase/carboxylesterase